MLSLAPHLYASKESKKVFEWFDRDLSVACNRAEAGATAAPSCGSDSCFVCPPRIGAVKDKDLLGTVPGQVTRPECARLCLNDVFCRAYAFQDRTGSCAFATGTHASASKATDSDDFDWYDRSSSAECTPVPRGNQPNIFLFLADDMSYDTLRSLGDPRAHTPNLDEFSAKPNTFEMTKM